MTSMNRRGFAKAALATGASVALGAPVLAHALSPNVGREGSGEGNANDALQQRRKFKLAYAPHFGMFTQHSGTDFVAQLEFMAAEGFTALEDNDMRRRSVAEQELIGKTLARLNMRMGVFVAHTID